MNDPELTNYLLVEAPTEDTPEESHMELEEDE